jgi:hypothetical protein
MEYMIGDKVTFRHWTTSKIITGYIVGVGTAGYTIDDGGKLWYPSKKMLPEYIKNASKKSRSKES